jgi:hypothetical protein
MMGIPIKFDTVVGLLLALVALPGVFLSREIQIGPRGKPFAPPFSIRVVVGIVFACVSFGFIFAGLGSPAAFIKLDNSAMAILDIFFLFFCSAVVIGGIRKLSGRTSMPRRRILKEAAFVFLFSMSFVLAVLDLISRISRF